MNAAETIQAAIDRLTGLRDQSSVESGDPWRFKGIGPLYQADIIDALDNVIVERAHGADAELIVTLHRTIDAQLAILRDGLTTHARVTHNTQKPSPGVDLPPSLHYGDPEGAERTAAHHVSRELDLARAILGGDK